MEPLGFPSAEAIVTVGRVAMLSNWKILDVAVVTKSRNPFGHCGDAVTLVILAAAVSVV